jgi:hypothetical protein
VRASPVRARLDRALLLSSANIFQVKENVFHGKGVQVPMRRKGAPQRSTRPSAQEGWIVYPDRRIEIFDADGIRGSSRFPVDMAELANALQAL